MYRLGDNIPEDKVDELQKRLTEAIKKTRTEEAKKHPAYTGPHTKEEWWALVDEWWLELLSIVERFVKLDRTVEEDGKLLGITGHIHIAQLKQNRDPKIVGYFDAAWNNAPDAGFIHAIPGWSVLCDLSSEQWVFEEGAVETGEVEYHELTELQYAPIGDGPWKLYVFGTDGYHSGAQWFCKGAPKYPDEEILSPEAMTRAQEAIAKGLEVRITTGGDELIFHSQDGVILYPESGQEQFWKEVGC